MQFVADGPDVPEALLQAHEEGRVVFFCGAGISYPAGLPGFKGLVGKIYKLVGADREPIEQAAYARGQFDATLDLLERRLGQRQAVRRVLAKALKPKCRKGATDTHKALLQLARGRDGTTRLVTTNFDRIFADLTAEEEIAVPAYEAPLLPIPKDSRWNGIVYLHGLLPKDPDPVALNRLVLTSGDFGLAYLTERWAARFVSELFRNYIVCFVGYSISDPVLRYMMDALAADRTLGENTPLAHAFGEYKPGEQENSKTAWEARGIIPILYSDNENHSPLHLTMKAWAASYRDGVRGKERVIFDYAGARPSVSSQQDDFVGRMVWALSDQSGLPAKRFADFDPAPSLEWLEVLSDNRYGFSDLARFNVEPHGEIDKKLTFSLVLRPAPYTLASPMMLASHGADETIWDAVMSNLGRWLLRHLDDPALILWLAKRGGCLHPKLASLIDNRLDEFANKEREDKQDELASIRARSPNAIPRELLRPVWRLLLSGRVKSPRRTPDLHRWKARLKDKGLSATLRFELRELLAPKVVLTEPFHWPKSDLETNTPVILKQLVNWELELASDHVHLFMHNMEGDEDWHRALPELLDDLQQLLRDALDLRRELGQGDDRGDGSHFELPSISAHSQNQEFHEWVALIELVRDAWLAVRERDPVRATQIARAWFPTRYPTFKRLALFAASQDGSVEPDEWVDWLLADATWLWSTEVRRETLRLLVLQGPRISPKLQGRLEAALLAGPPRAMYGDDLPSERWQELADRSVWLRLAKLQSSGVKLGEAATERLTELARANPEWRPADDERDEFRVWWSGHRDHDESSENDVPPTSRAELAEWLKQPQPQWGFREDRWPETCRSRFFDCVRALFDLAGQGEWPKKRWGEALLAWSEKELVSRSWRVLAPQSRFMPDEVLQKIAGDVAWWLEVVSRSLDRNKNILLDLCRRLLACQYKDPDDTGNPVDRAINHPVGHATQALLNLWFKGKPKDNENLPADLRLFFTQLCDTNVAKFRHGRVLLSANLIALFRVDQHWTKEHLLPLFDWTSSLAEARAAWEGFLWSPRLYQPLLSAFKNQFLDTVKHYARLSEHADRFAAFLTYAALNNREVYTKRELLDAWAALPQAGLDESAQALVDVLEGADEQREEYWANRIQPFLHDIWPKSQDLASERISESFARLSVAARGAFPAALDAVAASLTRIEDSDLIVHLLHEAKLADRFPREALSLLHAVVDDRRPRLPTELRECLNSISQAAPPLAQDPQYRRLEEYLRRCGV